MAKMKSYGVAVTVATNAIGGLTDANISGNDVSFIETTTHDSTSGFREFAGGLKDGGSLDLTGAFDIADTGQQYLRANPGVSGAVVVTYSDGTTSSFDAIIGGFVTTNPLDDKVEFNCSLKITGEVTYAAS